MFCINCGKRIPDDVKFCPECGYAVKKYNINDLQKDSSREQKEQNKPEFSYREQKEQNMREDNGGENYIQESKPPQAEDRDSEEEKISSYVITGHYQSFIKRHRHKEIYTEVTVDRSKADTKFELELINGDDEVFNLSDVLGVSLKQKILFKGINIGELILSVLMMFFTLGFSLVGVPCFLYWMTYPHLFIILKNGSVIKIPLKKPSNALMLLEDLGYGSEAGKYINADRGIMGSVKRAVLKGIAGLVTAGLALLGLSLELTVLENRSAYEANYGDENIVSDNNGKKEKKKTEGQSSDNNINEFNNTDKSQTLSGNNNSSGVYQYKNLLDEICRSVNIDDLFTLGYALEDVNNDGTQELLIGPMEPNEYTVGAVYYIYTISGNQYKCLYEGTDGNKTLHLCSDKTFVLEDIGDAAYNSWVHYKFPSGKQNLEFIDRVFYSEYFDGGAHTWFYTTDINESLTIGAAPPMLYSEVKQKFAEWTYHHLTYYNLGGFDINQDDLRTDDSYGNDVAKSVIVQAGSWALIDGYIIEESSTRYLNEGDLGYMTKARLRLARNEIYARHGRMFSDEYLQDYFNNQSWYHGTISPDAFNESTLSAIEKANAQLILQYEQQAD